MNTRQDGRPKNLNFLGKVLDSLDQECLCYHFINLRAKILHFIYFVRVWHLKLTSRQSSLAMPKSMSCKLH